MLLWQERSAEVRARGHQVTFILYHNPITGHCLHLSIRWQCCTTTSHWKHSTPLSVCSTVLHSQITIFRKIFVYTNTIIFSTHSFLLDDQSFIIILGAITFCQLKQHVMFNRKILFFPFSQTVFCLNFLWTVFSLTNVQYQSPSGTSEGVSLSCWVVSLSLRTCGDKVAALKI